MKRTLLILCSVVCICITHSAGHAREIDSTAASHFRTIVRLMLSGNAVELSKLIVYPLYRQNPLPNIANQQQFIAQFPMLIDSAFKERLKKYSDSDVFEHHGAYGLVGGVFSGDIWIEDDTDIKITSLNYSSDSEQSVRKALIAKQKEAMHPSIRNWDENIFVARSKKLLIRLDRIDTSIRYASWSNGKSQADKPDLVLEHGVEEAQGTMGGWTWTFKNNGYTYVVDDSEMGESEEYVGYFLYVSKGNKILSKSRLELVK